MAIMHWPTYGDSMTPHDRPIRRDSFAVFIGPAAAGERLRRFITDPTGHIRIPETPNAPGTDAGGAWLHVCDARDLRPAARRRDEAAIADALAVTPTRPLPGTIREIVEMGELFAERERAEAQPTTPATGAKERRGAGGRPTLKPAAEKKRLKLIADWKQAKGAGEYKPDFCNDRNVTVKHLDNCINWARTRDRRERERRARD
jgi:hypothetical protein